MSQLRPKIIKLKNFEKAYKKGESADSCWPILSGRLMVKSARLHAPLRHMIYQKCRVTGIQKLEDPGSKRAVTMDVCLLAASKPIT